MTKKELIELVAIRQRVDLKLSDKDVGLALKTLINYLADNLIAGNRIEVRGFGGFTVNKRNARMGRNPKTGEKLEIAATKMIHFKAGKELRDSVNAAFLAQTKTKTKTKTKNKNK